MKFKALVACAEGHRSGAIGVAVHFLPLDLDSELVDYIHETFSYSFYELDGKHSEVDASIYIEEDEEALGSYTAETMDYLNELLGETLEGTKWWDQVEAIANFDREVRSKLKYKTITKTEFTYDGEIVDSEQFDL